jgi:cytochrome c peroxidase
VLLAVGSLLSASPIACHNNEGDEHDALDLPVDPDTGLRIAALPPLPPVPEWEDNPYSEAKARLGQSLFSDPRLSGSGQGTCGNCHLPPAWFQSSTPTDVPDRSYPMLGPALRRNAPSLLNIVYAPMLRWDGSHFTNLYDAMVLPYAEANMNLSQLGTEAGEEVDIPGAQAALYAALNGIPGYVELFEIVFGVDIGEADEQQVWRLAGMALASYMSRVTTHGSVFDAWNQGEDVELSDAAIRGALLFAGEANCVVCHSGPLLSDFQFHNISSSPPGPDGARADEGRYLVTGREEDRGAFLTPMLRGASKTSPYFHDGVVTSVRGVIEQKSGSKATLDPNYDPLVALVPELRDEQVADIVEFLESLEGRPIDAEYLDMIELP